MAEISRRTKAPCLYRRSTRPKVSNRPDFAIMAGVLIACFSFKLPDDVFEPGEQRPQKKGTKGASKKRGASEVTSVEP